MLKLDSFFSKFKRVLETTRDQRDLAAAIISEHVGIPVPVENITIRNGDIIVSGSAALKSKIFISKQKILASLQQKAPKVFKDIR